MKSPRRSRSPRRAQSACPTGLREAGSVKREDVVLVLGANGKVGQAVATDEAPG